MNKPTLAIAVSGGIDSLVATFLLKKVYPDLFGIHFHTGYEDTKISKKTLEDCLGIDIICFDIGEEFEKNVISYFVNTYKVGQTPNPCLICNQYIKFGVLLKKAIKNGADYLATGHYAKIFNNISFPEKNITYPWLEKAKDTQKDQSYFLSRLDNSQLERIIFPLGDMYKHQVKQLAKEHNLAPIHPSESQDICFIPRGGVKEFIMTKTRNKLAKQGDIVDMHGHTIGTHNGLYGFTLGQRRGIDCPAAEPYYVKKINIKTNTLQVCHKKELGEKTAHASQMVWNKAFEFWDGITTHTKIRYAHTPALAKIFNNSGCIKIVFEQEQNAITPGQAAVFYNENKILGSAIIQ